MIEETTQPQNPAGEVDGQLTRGVMSNDPNTDTSGQGVPTSAPAETPTSEEPLIFGKYKTMEEAEKGFNEQAALLGRRMEDVLVKQPELLEQLGHKPTEQPFEIPFDTAGMEEEEVAQTKQALEVLGNVVRGAIQKEIAPLTRQRDLADAKETLGEDFVKALPGVVQTLKDIPELLDRARKRGENALVLAYNEMLVKKLPEVIQKAKEQGKLEAYSTQGQKQTPVTGQTPRSSQGGKAAFTNEQLADYKFFKEHEKEIDAALREKRI